MNPTSTTFCRHLRTKRMYIDATAEEAFAEKDAAHESPCHVWCNLTQTVKGRDDRPVNKTACAPGRSCFEA
jgi:hypothetical protein